MEPKLISISEEHDLFKFTLSNINVSLANALRRTILSDIPVLVLGTDVYKDNACAIEINTGRLHNELVKQRLGNIPVHVSNQKELETFPRDYVLEVDVKNDGDTTKIVTTEDFKIKHKETGKYMVKEEVKTIFPANSLTGYYIDVVRLRPQIGTSIQGEQLKLVCDFNVSTSRQNGMYSVVSKCVYSNTPDLTKIDEAWEQKRQRLLKEEVTEDELDMEKKNFYLLDAQRFYKENSFDFSIQTVGQYENKELIKKGCDILINKLKQMILALESDIVPISISETSVQNSYDVVLENEDYTIGKILEYILYETFYLKQELFSFCGFKKIHPHDTDSIVRVAYKSPTDKQMLRQHLKQACLLGIGVFDKIDGMF
jgi:DNA-directed RNA polymerase subunit L